MKKQRRLKKFFATVTVMLILASLSVVVCFAEAHVMPSVANSFNVDSLVNKSIVLTDEFESTNRYFCYQTAYNSLPYGYQSCLALLPEYTYTSSGFYTYTLFYYFDTVTDLTPIRYDSATDNVNFYLITIYSGDVPTFYFCKNYPEDDNVKALYLYRQTTDSTFIIYDVSSMGLYFSLSNITEYNNFTRYGSWNSSFASVIYQKNVSYNCRIAFFGYSDVTDGSSPMVYGNPIYSTLYFNFVNLSDVRNYLSSGGGTFIGEFGQLINTTVSVPINVLKSILNFELLGVNLWLFFTGVLTILIFVFVIRKVL